MESDKVHKVSINLLVTQNHYYKGVADLWNSGFLKVENPKESLDIVLIAPGGTATAEYFQIYLKQIFDVNYKTFSPQRRRCLLLQRTRRKRKLGWRFRNHRNFTNIFRDLLFKKSRLICTLRNNMRDATDFLRAHLNIR